MMHLKFKINKEKINSNIPDTIKNSVKIGRKLMKWRIKEQCVESIK